MADPKRDAVYEETKKSVQRIQSFESSTLARLEDLGPVLCFQTAVEPAQRLINLFRLISLEAIDDLPVALASGARTHADTVFNVFTQIQEFNLEQQQNPKPARDTIVAGLRNAYDAAFGQLVPIVAYSLRKSSDFGRLEREARATIQSLKDRIAEIEADMGKRKEEADSVLAEIRKVAAEQGVSQQAIYFRSEAETHDKRAIAWLKGTAALTVTLLLYAIGTFFLHKIPFLTPNGVYETAQLAVSKALVFVTIAFFLVLSARNYTAHRHNAVVNRHRQNGLVTYGALVKAASAGANSDIILTKAAECIFDAQSTGFAKGDGAESMSMVNFVPPSIKVGGGGP